MNRCRQAEEGLMRRVVIAAGILAVWLTGSASAWAQDCDPLKPSRTIDTEVRNVTEANANVLLRSLGQGSIRNDYQRIEQSQQFSNPDDANRWNSFIYMLCTLLKSSSLSDNDKLVQYFKLVELSRQSPPPTPPGTAASAPASKPKAGNVLYEADWSEDLNGWPAVRGWKHISNMLVSDGSPGHPARIWIPAPYQPDTTDYAVEAEIQLLNPQCGATYKEFGLIARAEREEGIIAGYKCSEVAIGIGSHFFRRIASQAFDAGSRWRTYRLEVQGNLIKLFVDGVSMLEAADNRYLSSGKLGMFSIGAQISVRSFKVIKL
jgi:hypothetical protein